MKQNKVVVTKWMYSLRQLDESQTKSTKKNEKDTVPLPKPLLFSIYWLKKKTLIAYFFVFFYSLSLAENPLL